MGIAILVSIIFAAGLLGGTANFFMESTDGKGLRKSIFLGLTAAATVPLFLKTVSSSLLDECLKGDPAFFSSYFVFFGFCTVAAIFSSKFLQSLGDKVLQEMNEVKQQQAELADTTNALISKNSDPEVPETPVINPENTSDGSELESFNLGSPTKTPVVVLSDEQKVISTLQNSTLAFRTVGGIAKDSGMDLGAVQSKLLELEMQGKVKKTKRSSDGAMVWCLK